MDAKFKLPEITPPIIGTTLETPFATVDLVTLIPTALPICFIMGYQNVLVNAFCGSF